VKGQPLTLLFALALASPSAAQDPPFQLTRLMAKAHLRGTVASWCRGEFRGGYAGAFAVAVRSAPDSGRYVIVDTAGSIADLARYADGAEVSCFTRAEAQDLSKTLANMKAVHGSIRPRFDTTVVCAFLSNSEAACWQCSPAGRAFVRSGGWVT